MNHTYIDIFRISIIFLKSDLCYLMFIMTIEQFKSKKHEAVQWNAYLAIHLRINLNKVARIYLNFRI